MSIPIFSNIDNSKLMNDYINTLHEKVLPRCLCSISIDACINARKKRVTKK